MVVVLWTGSKSKIISNLGLWKRSVILSYFIYIYIVKDLMVWKYRFRKERYIKRMNDIQGWILLYQKLKNKNNTFLKNAKTWKKKTKNTEKIKNGGKKLWNPVVGWKKIMPTVMTHHHNITFHSPSSTFL